MFFKSATGRFDAQSDQLMNHCTLAAPGIRGIVSAAQACRQDRDYRSARRMLRLPQHRVLRVDYSVDAPNGF